MIEINDAKIAVVHEIGLITNISKLHRPDNGQIIYNVTIISNNGTSMFAINKELFEQWILGINQAMNELDGKKIVVPHLRVSN